MKKKIISSVLLATMVLGAVSAFAAEKEPAALTTSAAADEVIEGVPQIAIDGKNIDLSKLNVSQYMYSENGNTLVPLRAVAEEMGYKVEWDNEDKAVTVSDDEWKVVFNIGVDSYYGVTKIKDAVGMTAPQAYGVAPKLIEGTTYVPAKMFELIGYEFSSVGQYADFTKAGTKSDEAVQIPNPLSEYKTVEEAKKAVAFEAKIPSKMTDGYKLDYVGTIAGEILQLDYVNGDKNILYRTAEGTEDISGDYNKYNTKELEIGDIKVTYRENGEASGAIWTDGKFTFSIMSNSVMTEKEVENIIVNLK